MSRKDELNILMNDLLYRIENKAGKRHSDLIEATQLVLELNEQLKKYKEEYDQL